MRQAGVLAAAGIYALNHHVERLAQDHDNARALAQGLSDIEGVSVDPSAVQTNMVSWRCLPSMRMHCVASCVRAISCSARQSCTPVTHLDVGPEDVRAVVQAVQEFLARATHQRVALQPG